MFDPLVSPSYEDEYPRLVIDLNEMAKHVEKVDMPLVSAYTKSEIGPTERLPLFLKNGDTMVKKGSVSRKSLMDFIALVNRASIKAYDENRKELVGNNIYQLSLEEF